MTSFFGGRWRRFHLTKAMMTSALRVAQGLDMDVFAKKIFKYFNALKKKNISQSY
jgi:hypothetical protein